MIGRTFDDFLLRRLVGIVGILMNDGYLFGRLLADFSPDHGRPLRKRTSNELSPFLRWQLIPPTLFPLLKR